MPVAYLAAMRWRARWQQRKRARMACFAGGAAAYRA